MRVSSISVTLVRESKPSLVSRRLIIPIRGGLAGTRTYGGGRYVIDTVNGADLGGNGNDLVIDLNFAYDPSCAYDPAWACPLAPPGNVVRAAVAAGELTA
jgi:uncharacterized protein (DUF1684 family)